MENEIPVNAAKIIEQSKQWTLEGDCVLLQWMNQISKNLEERVTKTSSAINDLSTNLDRTTVSLCNVTNSLAALQYSQFVENRVIEDDETLSNTPEAPNTDVTENQAASKNIYSFLKKNIEMMNSCHEAVSISYEDSDDDEPATNVVYRSKNPYEARPLPYIYGSELWKDKWHIGLCDSDNDYSGDENSEKFSESSSSDDESFESNAPTLSEWDSTAWGLNTNQNIDRKENHTPSNDGESTYQGEEYSQSKVSTPRAQTNIPNVQQPVQDQRYYQHIPRSYQQAENLFDNNPKPPEMPQVTIPPPKKVIQEAYIPDEPPPDEQAMESENNRRIGAKKTLNLFDDDEFSSFMDQIVQKATNKSVEPPGKSQVTPTTAKGPSLVEQEPSRKMPVPNLFNDTDEVDVAPVRVNQDQTRKPATVSNLFNDSEDLFSSLKPAQEPQKKVIPNLFDDSEDLFKEKSSQPVAVEKEKSPVRTENEIFNSPSQAVTIGRTKLKNLFDDDDDDDDDFDSLFASKPKPSNTFAQRTSNLFEDDLAPSSTSKDLFPKKEEIKEVSSNNSLATGKTLFDDEDDSIGILRRDEVSKAPEVKQASIKEVSLLKKGLFDDDVDMDDESDIFAKKPAPKSQSGDSLSKKNPSAMRRNSLFGDEDEGKLEHPQNLNNSSSNTTKVFGGVESKGSIDDSSPHGSKNVRDIFADDFTDEISEIVPKNEATQDIKQKDPRPVVEQSKMSNVVQEKFVKESKDVIQGKTQLAKKSVKPKVAPKLPVIARKPQVSAVNKKATKHEENPKESLDNPNTFQHQEEKPKNSEPVETTPKLPDIPRKPILLSSAKTITENKVQKVENIARSSSGQSDVVPEIASSSDFSSWNETKVTQHEKEFFSDTKDVGASTSTVTGGEKSVETLPTVSLSNEESTATEVKPKEQKPKPSFVYEEEDQSLESASDHKYEPKEQHKIIPSYTSLFQDDLPPEDENPNVASYENSPMHTTDEDVLGVPNVPTAASYNSINLFADVPPDDDDFLVTVPSSSETKRIHSIFYDDFHETIEAGREMRSPASYIINDEPPPDECDSKPVVSNTTSEKPKVSKLKKMDFQINVGALLPSAKIPSFKKPSESPKTHSRDDEVPTFKEPIAPVAKSVQVIENVPSEGQQIQPRELPDNILPNLNRDRAKVQIKRRPSTRQGRQESYRKSMIEERTVDDQKESDDEDESIEKINKPGIFEDLGKFSLRKTEETTDAVTPNPKRADLFEGQQSNVPAEIFTQPVEAKQSKFSSMFDEVDSDPENIIKTMKSTGEMSKTLNFAPVAVKDLDSLFESDGEDENPFGTPKAIISQVVTNKETPKVTREQISKPVADQPIQPITASSKFASSAPDESVKAVSLFGESDDGSDDLFKEAKTHKKSVPPKNTEKQQKPKSVPKPVKPTSSLFSSDEGSGSGDDIFGKSKLKVTTKKVDSSKEKSSGGLFADLSDDDDDDLFRTAKKKPVGVDKSKPSNKKQPSKMLTKPDKGNSVNPLSDLLGP